MTHQDQLITAAKAQDLYDLQQHIAWTDVIQPKLKLAVQQYATLLVNEALGSPLPPGKTREQIAGVAYGINYICDLFERILKDGERALVQLGSEGISINTPREVK
jgi:hypothetical protein